MANITEYINHFSDGRDDLVAFQPRDCESFRNVDLTALNAAITDIFAKTVGASDSARLQIRVHVYNDYTVLGIEDVSTGKITQIQRTANGYQIASDEHIDRGDLENFNLVVNAIHDLAPRILLKQLQERSASAPAATPGIPPSALLPGSPYVIHIGCCGGNGGGYAANPDMTVQLQRLNATLERLEETVTRLARRVEDFIESRGPRQRDDSDDSENSHHRRSSRSPLPHPRVSPGFESHRLQEQLRTAQEENELLGQQLQALRDENEGLLERNHQLGQRNTQLEREALGLEELQQHNQALRQRILELEEAQEEAQRQAQALQYKLDAIRNRAAIPEDEALAAALVEAGRLIDEE